MSKKAEEEKKEGVTPTTITLIVVVAILALGAGYMNWPTAKKPVKGKGMTPAALAAAQKEAQAMLRKRHEEQAEQRKKEGPTPLNTNAPQEIINNASSVLRIFAIKPDGKVTQGSGFQIQAKTPTVLTGQKVTEGAEILVLESHGKTWVATAWAENKKNKVTMIPAEASVAKNVAALKLTESKNGSGSQVIGPGKAFTTGYPLGEDIAIIEGTIWGRDPKTAELDFGGEISLGALGGPVANENGEIIAIFTGFNPGEESVNKGATPHTISENKTWERVSSRLAPEAGARIKEELEELGETTVREKIAKAASEVANAHRSQSEETPKSGE